MAKATTVLKCEYCGKSFNVSEQSEAEKHEEECRKRQEIRAKITVRLATAEEKIAIDLIILSLPRDPKNVRKILCSNDDLLEKFLKGLMSYYCDEYCRYLTNLHELLVKKSVFVAILNGEVIGISLEEHNEEGAWPEYDPFHVQWFKWIKDNLDPPVRKVAWQALYENYLKLIPH